MDLVFKDDKVDLSKDIALLQHLVLTGKFILDIIENSELILANKLMKTGVKIEHIK